MLTDFEVLDLLQTRGAASDHMACLGKVSVSECKVYDYLTQKAACNQTREGIQSFKLRCEEFMKRHGKRKLAKSEILNVINFRPSSYVELYAVLPLDDCFKMDADGNSPDADEFLKIVCDLLSPPPTKPEQEGAEEEDEMDQDDGL
ncbi:hypothetical protein HPP92_022630 [Vanilla planifolia]|uniref:DNA-directed RNA polymerase III subunit RPC9 n=1 Tax=Vanilla planifolia TaxID=51239 RepID=A0A835UF97_VANPL|nr:hypothetical protein HPP92_022630 [Vanilla planifolia]